MADDICPASERPRALAVLSSGGPTVAAAFLVTGGVGGRWLIDGTGPAAAYWNDTGTGGRYEIDAVAVAHDAFFKQVNTRFKVR